MAGLNRRRLLKHSVAALGLAAVSGPISSTAAPSAAALRLRPEPGIARLSANENPYGPSPKALAAARQAVERGAYYPGPISQDLVSMIASGNDISEDHVAISSGSNEALCAAMAAFGREGSILTAELTYSPHLRYASQVGVDVVRVPLAQDMAIDLAALAERSRQGDIALIYICNPNNPTGMVLDANALRAFCNEVSDDVVVLVDEAYNELTDDPDGNSMMDLVRADQRVIVMRTFSKLYGLAGLRVGYTMATPELAAKVADHVMAWPNVAGLAAAIASYEDRPFIEFSRRQISDGRSLICAVFAEHGVPYLPSQTNFVYADIGRSATEFAAAMLARGVQIRSAYPPYETYSRVSTGKLEDLKTFTRVFAEVYNA
jgi:histidinol-phosphate aminotransferase